MSGWSNGWDCAAEAGTASIHRFRAALTERKDPF